MNTRNFLINFGVLMGLIALIGCKSEEMQEWDCDDAETIKYEDMEESEITEELSTAVSLYGYLEGTWTGTLSCSAEGEDQEPKEVTVEISNLPSAGQLDVICGPGPEVGNVLNYECDALALAEGGYLTIFGTDDDIIEGKQVEISGALFSLDERDYAYGGGGSLEVDHDEIEKFDVDITMSQGGGEIEGEWLYFREENSGNDNIDGAWGVICSFHM